MHSRACTAPPDALLRHTGRVRCTSDPCAESSANSQGHRTRATGRTLSVPCSPDSCAERVAKTHAHRTLSTGLTPVRPVHYATPDNTPDAKGQRPVPPRSASGECFSDRDFSKFPTSAIENIHLIFSKAPNVPTPPSPERGTHTPLNPRNSTSFANVPTPPSVHHHVHVC